MASTGSAIDNSEANAMVREFTGNLSKDAGTEPAPGHAARRIDARVTTLLWMSCAWSRLAGVGRQQRI